MGKTPYASLSQPNVISPSSSFKPKLSDQDYMELVCENGQIFAKSRRPNNNGYFQNQRTQSLLDFYETEYDEDFKKNIKNLGDSQVVPGREPQHPQQDEETDEQTNDNNNNKKKKIKPSKNEFERNVW
ncbi:Transcription factor PIL1 [Raphanus sativus]|nr:Transcription factor PIL1 [Raphanus sativus]